LSTFVSFNQLTPSQTDQYYDAISKAFPTILSKSEVIKTYWSRLEKYFPAYQLYLLAADGDLIGFINTVPFHFSNHLSDLPDSGWDWMLTKGIADFENSLSPNLLGGLQVIVRDKYQKAGYSKRILNYAKQIYKSSNFSNLVIPIRPTKKHTFPEMPMADYLNKKEENEIFDPWVRTHVKGGAEIIKVCNQSMSVRGDIPFWETILDKKIYKSGSYKLDGALELINIDIQNNMGEYIEPNIWVKYE